MTLSLWHLAIMARLLLCAASGDSMHEAGAKTLRRRSMPENHDDLRTSMHKMMEDDLTTEVTNLKLHPTKIQVARFTNVATRKVSTPTRLA